MGGSDRRLDIAEERISDEGVELKSRKSKTKGGQNVWKTNWNLRREKMEKRKYLKLQWLEISHFDKKMWIHRDRKHNEK